MFDVIGAFSKAERGHQRAGNAASVTGSREDFHLQVDAQRGAQTKAPRHRGAPKLHLVLPSGSDLGPLDLQDFAGTRDRDRPRLHRLRDLAHEVDVQEPILQARTLDLHIVGELEATFEVPRGDALVEYVATLLLVVGCFSPRSVNVFSFTSIARSASVKPATATEMRYGIEKARLSGSD
jgi:hypothetical protein